MKRKWFAYENIWARNIIFGVFLLSLAFLQNEYSGGTKDELPTQAFTFIWQFALMYSYLFCFNHYMVRKLLFAKKYFLFIIYTVVYLIILALAATWLEDKSATHLSFKGQLLGAFTILFISVAIYLAHIGILNSIFKNKIKLLQKDSELNFLKQQVSPHFLYNALNNLYGTALTTPELVAEKILELAALLRYQVEAVNKINVGMDEEREFIENYINYIVYKTNDLTITNTTIGAIKNFQVPSLLFLPLFENAIKYASETEKAFVNIVWTFKPNGISFFIENSYLSMGSKLNGTKTGLNNLNKRLELLNIKNNLITDQKIINTYKSELVLWGLSTNV